MIRSEYPASQPSVSSTPLLELRDLCKSFGETFAVDHVSLTSERGQILALLGENGAGKSTVIKLLAGITNPIMVRCGSTVNLSIIIGIVRSRSSTKITVSSIR